MSMLWQLAKNCLALGLAGLLAAPAALSAEYLGPTAVIASRDGRRLFVANSDARQIAIVDAATGKVVRSVPLQAKPTGMVSSLDRTRVYVTCAAPKGTVVMLETGSGKLIESVSVGHTPMGPAVAPDGKQLYVCNRFDNNVSVIDLTGRREVARIPVSREPVAAAVTPDGKLLYVANLLPQDRSDLPNVAAAVTVIDTASRKTVNIRLPNGSSSVRGICVSPDGKHAYAVHVLARYQLPVIQADRGWMNTNAMSVFDAPAKKLIGTVLLDDVDRGAANPWGVTMTADGKTLLVSHSGTHELSVIDSGGLLDKLASATATGTAAETPNDLAFLVGLRERIRLQGNGPRGLVAVGSKVYAAEYFSDSLAVVDLKASGASVVSRIALGPRPRPTVQRRGEMLFHDAEIGFQYWQSCSTCHPDARADGLNWDLPNDGLGNPKNTRSLLLVDQRGPTMALGVRSSAEDAVRAGIAHVLFAVQPEEDVAAIVAYLKSLEPVPSPRLVEGKLSPAAERGKAVFFGPKVDCARCHAPPVYCDQKSHRVASLGRYDQPDDTFTTACLIEVWRTAPYMHDGQYLTIKELLVHGRHGLHRHGSNDLSDQEIDDLIEFVLSL